MSGWSVLGVLLVCCHTAMNSSSAHHNCFPEISLCQEKIKDGFGLQQYLAVDVEFHCPPDHQVQVIDVAMDIYVDFLPCGNQSLADGSYNSPGRPNCALNRNQIAEEPFVKDIETLQCGGSSSCNKNITYGLPSNSTLDQHCGFNDSGQNLFPVLNLVYKCVKSCASGGILPLADYYHTMNKSCTADVNVATLYAAHAFFSSDELFDILFNYIIAQRPLTNVDLRYLAVSGIHGFCQFTVKQSSTVKIGTYNVLQSYFLTEPESLRCDQRLVMHDVQAGERLVYCSGNVTYLNMKVVTGSVETKRYRLWYESDEPDGKAVFFIPIEVDGGEVSITCCGNGEMDANIKTTLTSPTQEITEDPDPVNPNVLIIAVTSVLILVVIILIVLVIIVLLKRKVFCKPEPVPDRRHSLEQDPANESDNESLYDQMDETAIGRNPPEKSGAAGLRSSYLTAGEYAAAGKDNWVDFVDQMNVKRLQQDDIDTNNKNDPSYVSLRQPSALDDDTVIKPEVAEQRDTYFKPALEKRVKTPESDKRDTYQTPTSISPSVQLGEQR